MTQVVRKQGFCVLRPDAPPEGPHVPIADDFNRLQHDVVTSVFQSVIEANGWDPTSRYVALGDAGDVVVYEGGCLEFTGTD